MPPRRSDGPQPSGPHNAKRLILVLEDPTDSVCRVDLAPILSSDGASVVAFQVGRNAVAGDRDEHAAHRSETQHREAEQRRGTGCPDAEPTRGEACAAPTSCPAHHSGSRSPIARVTRAPTRKTEEAPRPAAGRGPTPPTKRKNTPQHLTFRAASGLH
jgi:hypothetical protein